MGQTSSSLRSGSAARRKAAAKSGQGAVPTFRAIADKYSSIAQVTQALRANGLESSNLLVCVDLTKAGARWRLPALPARAAGQAADRERVMQATRVRAPLRVLGAMRCLSTAPMQGMHACMHNGGRLSPPFGDARPMPARVHARLPHASSHARGPCLGHHWAQLGSTRMSVCASMQAGLYICAHVDTMTRTHNTVVLRYLR